MLTTSVWKVYRDSTDDAVIVKAESRVEAERIGAGKRGWRRQDVIARYLYTSCERAHVEVWAQTVAGPRGGAARWGNPLPQLVQNPSAVEIESAKERIRAKPRNAVSRLVRS